MFIRKSEPKPFEPTSAADDKKPQPFAAPIRNDIGATSSSAAAEVHDITPVAARPAEPELDESVIGSDLSIEGQAITIRCKGLLRVNGNIQADLHGKKLIVGDEATITGVVTAEAVDVYGKVHGSIQATSVLLRATSEVEGDITSRTLSIEPGAAFDGRARKLKDNVIHTPREPAVTPIPAIAS